MNVKLSDTPRVSVVYDGQITSMNDGCLVTVLEVVGILLIFGYMVLTMR